MACEVDPRAEMHRQKVASNDTYRVTWLWNLHSAAKALEHVGATVDVTQN